MKPLNKVIVNKDTSFNPIWIMRQAGRYLPEFRAIRKENPNFINLCLNDDLSSEITLQPLKRFDLDAAIIFSDILMLPYGLGQKVEFEKNFGPKLGEINLNEIAKTDEIDFVEKIHRVYKAIKKVSSDNRLNKKNRSSNKVSNIYNLWKINKNYNNLDFLNNLKSIINISINSIRIYGWK